MALRFAVLFKTHFWDGFVERQLQRLIRTTRHGDVFVVMDDRFGHASKVTHDRVFRITEHGATELGLPAASTDKSLFWYNVDYGHYLFFRANPTYDYYVASEYDVSVQVDLEKLVQDIDREQIDYLGCPIKNPAAWPWAKYHADIYTADEIRLALSCFSIYSRRAVSLLLQRRLAMAEDFRNGALSFWPNNEAFIPTEIGRANYKSASLDKFGSIKAYDWWPPMHEAELSCHPDEAFIHPVLEGGRYIRSILRHEKQLFSFFDRHSPLSRRLAHQGSGSFRWAFCREFAARSLRYMERKLENAGLRRPWTANAARPARPASG